MYRTILLAYVGPSFSEAALTHAVALTQAFDAELHLLCLTSIPIEVELAKASGTTDVLEQKKQQNLLAVKGQAQRLRDQGMSVTESWCEGDPTVEIGLYAHRIAADLVIMGNTDKKMLVRWLRSDGGSKLLAHLPCSVLFP